MIYTINANNNVFHQNKIQNTLDDVRNEFRVILNWYKEINCILKKTELNSIWLKKMRGKKDMNIVLHGQGFDASYHTIYLGKTIDDKLNWVEHIDKVKNEIPKVHDIINY